MQIECHDVTFTHKVTLLLITEVGRMKLSIGKFQMNTELNELLHDLKNRLEIEIGTLADVKKTRFFQVKQ